MLIGNFYSKKWFSKWDVNTSPYVTKCSRTDDYSVYAFNIICTPANPPAVNIQASVPRLKPNIEVGIIDQKSV